jgi:3-phenylpropionate/trans-cinnamate dioxygenase ferredoxin reductase component
MSHVANDGHICVVGGSLAAATAASTLKGLGHQGRITMVSRENVLPYARPALSKSVLRGIDSYETTRVPVPGGVDLLLGLPAIGLDLSNRRLELVDGTSLPYDGLMIATGARARTLPEAGDNVWTLRTMDDAINLRTSLMTADTMIVVGGGPLAMEVASTATTLGVSVTLVCGDIPMRAHVGQQLARTLMHSAASAGVEVIIGAQPATLVKMSDTQSAVVNDRGDLLTADVIVTAVGCAPNTEWLNGTGIHADEGGVVVDSHLFAADNVVAAGDVAVLHDGPSGARRTPVWASAVNQSIVAATNLVRRTPDVYTPRPFFWTEQFGHRLKVAGVVRDDALVTIEGRKNGAIYRWSSSDGVVEAAAALDVPISMTKLSSFLAPSLIGMAC